LGRNGDRHWATMVGPLCFNHMEEIVIEQLGAGRENEAAVSGMRVRYSAFSRGITILCCRGARIWPPNELGH
jgi:hypothetical protein